MDEDPSASPLMAEEADERSAAPVASCAVLRDWVEQLPVSSPSLPLPQSSSPWQLHSCQLQSCGLHGLWNDPTYICLRPLAALTGAYSNQG